LSIWRGSTLVSNWTSVACQNGVNSATLHLFSGLAPGTDYRIRLSWTKDYSYYFWSPPFTI
jgi:hypothetical protein